MALGLFLCSDFTARAHVADGVADRLFQNIVEGDWLDAVSERQRSPETTPDSGPQVDRFDAVDGTHPETLDAQHDWQRLDAALARAGTASLGVSSETLSGNGRPSLRHQRGTVEPSDADHAPQATLVTVAAGCSARRAVDPVVVPIGTPLCYPARRASASFIFSPSASPLSSLRFSARLHPAEKPDLRRARRPIFRGAPSARSACVLRRVLPSQPSAPATV
mgnify:CR=1 FL=1